MFKVNRKYHQYNSDGQITHTHIEIVDDIGTVFVGFLPTDDINKSDEELIKATCDFTFKKHFVNRAMGEAVQKVDEMAPIIEEVRKTTEKVDAIVTLVSNTALELGDKTYAVEDLIKQIIQKMGWHINEDGEVVVAKDSEVEGGE